MIGLLSGRVNKDYHIGDDPCRTDSFLNRSVAAKGQYLAQNFKTPRWIHSIDKLLWSIIVGYMPSSSEFMLKDLGLY